MALFRKCFNGAFRQVHLILILGATAWGQGFHAGVKAGIPITQYFETGVSGSLHGGANYSAATRRYVVGASAEWQWSKSFGVELDALYHRMGYVGIVSQFSNGLFTNSAIDVKGNSWDFPLLVKYRFSLVARPFVAGGGVLRYVGPVHGHGQRTDGSLITGTSSTVPLDTTDPSELRKRFYPGITAGGGLEFGARRVRLLPEFRYTRWTANISGPGGLLRFAPNQAEFILGALF